MHTADRCERIAPFHVMALLERAQALEAAGHDVIHLEVGEPDFPSPPGVLEAGRRALADGATRYTPAAGLPELREAIADWYRQRFGVNLDAGRVIVTPGASGALQLALALVVNPGDGFLLADPGYPCNRHFLELVNGEAQPLLLDPGQGLRVNAVALAEAWRDNTVGALLASPDNPTGNVLDAGELATIANAVRERNGVLLMDEIYQGLNYAEPAHTVLSVAPEALVLNSFSKFFGMTGWRVGWLVAPEEVVEPLVRMAQNFFLAPSTPAQHAALAAFDVETRRELERRREELDRRRRLLLDRLPGTGLRVVGRPEGAFYLYLDVSEISGDAFGFCQRLLEEAHVALTPGLDFGEGHGPSGYLRLAYTASRERLEEALERIRRFVERQ